MEMIFTRLQARLGGSERVEGRQNVGNTYSETIYNKNVIISILKKSLAISP